MICPLSCVIVPARSGRDRRALDGGQNQKDFGAARRKPLNLLAEQCPCLLSNPLRGKLSLTSLAACVLVPFMQTEPTLSLADRFARFIERLCAVIGVYAAVFPWGRPLVAAAQGRVRRLGDQFAHLAARVSAGTLRARRKGVARRPDMTQRRPPTLPPTSRWLMQAVARLPSIARSH